MKILLLLLLPLVFLSCQKEQKAKNRLEIQIEHLRKTDSWRVTYHLPYPSEALYFNRQTNTFRHDNWRILSPNWEFKLIDGEEYLVSTKGKQTEIMLEHPSYYAHTPKDYEFFISYSNGDVLMFSGHYDASPLKELLDRTMSVKDYHLNVKTEFLFLPSEKEKIVILGKVYQDQKISWSDQKGRGTYIYWGNTNIQETPRLTIVIDPKTPEWINHKIKDLLPKIFDYYAQKTKLQLDFKPVVYLNYSKSGGGYGGGSLPGMLQLSVKGEDFQKESKKSLESLMGFIAHEGAHLWNGQMTSGPGGAQAWLHEGGADAFSFRALRDFNIISREKYQELIQRSLNLCILGLVDQEPIVSTEKSRKFKNYYYCGSTINYLVEQSLESKDIYVFWKKLFEKAQMNEGNYTDEDYFQLAKELKVSPKMIEILKNLVYKKGINLAPLFVKAFGIIGVKLDEIDEATSGREKYNIAMELLKKLYKSNCQNDYSISSTNQGYMIYGEKECPLISSDFEVETVEGQNLKDTPYQAWKKTFAKCKEKQPVSLIDTSGKTISFQCDSSFFKLNLYKLTAPLQKVQE